MYTNEGNQPTIAIGAYYCYMCVAIYSRTTYASVHLATSNNNLATYYTFLSLFRFG